MSWEFWFPWIMTPAHKKSKALNKACVIKWKKASSGKLIEIANIITPSWLKVDKAIIFFRSYSKKATNPDINIVNEEIINNMKFILLLENSENRIKRYTPAVTRVEEWTKAETGVGAAIAAGSQAEKGIWALLVIAPNITKKEIHSILFIAVVVDPQTKKL